MQDGMMIRITKWYHMKVVMTTSHEIWYWSREINSYSRTWVCASCCRGVCITDDPPRQNDDNHIIVHPAVTTSSFNNIQVLSCRFYFPSHKVSGRTIDSCTISFRALLMRYKGTSLSLDAYGATLPAMDKTMSTYVHTLAMLMLLHGSWNEFVLLGSWYEKVWDSSCETPVSNFVKFFLDVIMTVPSFCKIFQHNHRWRSL